MAKSKDKKKKPAPETSSPADAVRSAVEQALAATFGGAASPRGRAQDLVEEIGSATTRVRQAIDDLRVIDDLRGLRSELEALNARVAALEAAKSAATPAPARASAGTKPAGTRARSTATRSTNARSAASARKDVAARKPPASDGPTPSTPRSAASARKAPATEPPSESSAGRS